MHECRVYLPLEPDDVRALARDKEIRATVAYAVTQWLERAHPAEDEEGLEYLALHEALAAGLAARAAAGVPIVIAAADIASDRLGLHQPPVGDSPAATGLTGAVPLKRVVSLHVEERPVGSSDEPDLLWYDVTELDEVVRLLS